MSILAVGLCFLSSAWGGARQARPNVVIFFVDDMGWKDLGVNGSEFYETPHIDALAARGVNFKSSYSANPVCSPIRAAMMTGKAPQRVGITNWIPEKANIHLPLSEVTLGEAFLEAGYQTGYVGKWHLGKEDGVQPGKQGFDWVKAVNRAGQPSSYFYPFKKGKRNRGRDVPDLAAYTNGDYLTDALTDQALTFIDEHKEQPFFLCLAHYAVHTPIQAPEVLIKKYEAKKIKLYGNSAAEKVPGRYNSVSASRQDNPAYAAMVENLDTNIGRVLARLDKYRLKENTIIIFTSDNGGLVHHRDGGPTCNLPLRSGKGWTYEGGVRIPTLISWPGKINPAVSEVPVITMDMYPTLLDLCGIPLKPEQHSDGISLKGVLSGVADNEVNERFLAWAYPHTHGSHKPSATIQQKGWKLIKFSEGKPFELYQLVVDIGEKKDLAEQFPETVKELDQLLRLWLKETMPVNSVVAEDQIPALLEQMDPFFGVNADVEEPALLETSAFKNLSLDDGKLFFDLGNNMVNAAVGPRGTIQRALIFSGIERKPMTAGLPGVWYSYDFLNICRSDRFGFQIGGELVYLDKIGLKQETRLIDGAFSLASVQIDDLKIHQLVMAPYSKGDAVSGLLVGFYIETGSTTPVKAKLLIAPQWLLNRTMAHDHKWKSTNQLLRNFVDIVSKRGNYLLNIGPDGKGNVPEPCVERFQEMGVWVKNNADAIFGTTRWTTFHEAGSKQKQSKAASPDEFWFSAKGDKVYAMSLAPGAGTVRILSLKKSTGKALNVRLLGSDKSMKWIQTDEALEIDFTGVETSDNG